MAWITNRANARSNTGHRFGLVWWARKLCRCMRREVRIRPLCGSALQSQSPFQQVQEEVLGEIHGLRSEPPLKSGLPVWWRRMLGEPGAIVFGPEDLPQGEDEYSGEKYPNPR